MLDAQDVRTWAILHVLDVGRGCMSISWRSHGGPQLLLMTLQASVLQLDVATGAMLELASDSPPHRLLCHAFSPETHRLVAAGEPICAEAATAYDAAAAAQAQHAQRHAKSAIAPQMSLADELLARCQLEEASAAPDADVSIDPMFQDTLTIKGGQERGRRVRSKAFTTTAEQFVGRCPIDLWDLSTHGSGTPARKASV